MPSISPCYRLNRYILDLFISVVYDWIQFPSKVSDADSVIMQAYTLQTLSMES